ncbi:MAG: 2OG-Fe dioxygenase family protein [Bacteroidota bacterium]
MKKARENHRNEHLDTEKGYLVVLGDVFDLSEFHSSYLDEVTSSWDNLPMDEYLAEKQRQGEVSSGFARRRRLGKFRINNPDGGIEVLPFDRLTDKKYKFIQAREVNSLHGNESRYFDPIAPKIHPFLFSLINKNMSIIRQLDNNRVGDWNIYVHQVRIEAIGGEISHPAPEGIHCDGHDFLSIHHIKSRYSDGGISRIYTKDQIEVAKFKLENFLETIFLNDQRWLHSVDPIQSFSNEEHSFRDVLIMDYNQL